MIGTINIDELTVLHAKPTGERRYAVLFVHGYFVDGSVWKDWLEFFSARGVDAYAVNLRGRSGSRPGTNLGRTSIADFVDDAAAVAKHVRADVVVGHSMGGLVAQKLAERDAVRAAVLITPAPPRGISVVSPRVAWLQLKYMPAILMSKVVTPGREDLREIVLNRIPAHAQDAMLDAMLPDSGRAGRDMSVTGFPVDERRVHCPMLVINAEDDQFIRPRIVERVAARYKARLETAKHHGHMVINEPNWEEIANLVETWIRDHL
jgi:non-heme chloroperoxidase